LASSYVLGHADGKKKWGMAGIYAKWIVAARGAARLYPSCYDEGGPGTQVRRSVTTNLGRAGRRQNKKPTLTSTMSMYGKETRDVYFQVRHGGARGFAAKATTGLFERAVDVDSITREAIEGGAGSTDGRNKRRG